MFSRADRDPSASQVETFFVLGSEWNTVEMETQVVWTDFCLNKAWGDYRSGIRFTDISTNDMTKLKMFIKNPL
jgi:hypothetical protein